MDYLPSEELRELQLRRLMATVSLAYEKQALFRSRMEERGLTPASIRSLDDIALLPFTIKADLRDTYPFGLFAKPMSEIVRLHASSGTTGKPIVVAYTKKDIEVWADAIRRAFICAGLGEHDIIQNSYGYGLFTGGLGAHYGGEKLGATVIPTSGGNTDRQIMVMKDFGVTAICCTPSYLAYLLERAEELGINVQELPLKAAILGAEPWAWETGRRLEKMGGLRVFDIYGLSEIVGPGVGMMCGEQDGLHIFEDYFYPEIINPDTCEVLPDGQEGELVLTTLAKEAMPMIRYRTRDITSIITQPCPCGRTCRRINRISRRSDDMMILRGVNVFPSQIETALMAVEGTLPHYQIVLTTRHGLDQMEVQVEVTAEHFGDRIRELEDLKVKLAKSIERTVGIRIDVTLVKPQTIERSQGKAKRIVDLRKK